MTLQEYLDTLKGKTVAVIGIGVSNTPLLRMLLRAGIDVTACDKRRNWNRWAPVCSWVRTTSRACGRM